MPSEHMQNVKIFGDYNTGTNALTMLIEQNSASRCLPSKLEDIIPTAHKELATTFADDPWGRERAIDEIFDRTGVAFKHCATIFRGDEFGDCLTLFIVRHPASWLVSLFDNPYDRLTPRVKTIQQFLEQPRQTVGRERLEGLALTPLQMYQAKVRSYFAFAAKLRGPHFFLRHEDIVLEQGSVFFLIAPHLNSPALEFAPVESSTKHPSKRLADYQVYYQAESWRKRLTTLEDAVNGAVDWELFAPFGYKPL